MVLEVKIRMYNLNDPPISLSKLLEIKDNVEFLAGLPPLKIFDRFKGRKIDYSKGYRLIRVSKGFKSIKVTPEIEREKGWQKGLYSSTSVQADFFEYWVWDTGDVERFENNPGETPIGDVKYKEDELRKLRGK